MSDPEAKADEIVKKAANVASAIQMEAEVVALQLVNQTKEVAAKAEVIISLAENKAKSLVESAAKDATGLIEMARQSATKLYADIPKGTPLDINVLSNEVGHVRRIVEKIENKLEKDYVTRTEFAPIQKGFYGLITFVLLAVLGVLGTVIIIVLSAPKT